MFDLTLYNGKIYTLKNKEESFSYVCINKGKIVSLGNNIDQNLLQASKKIINLKGRVVLPSFGDSHVHLVQTGLNYLGLDLSHITSVNDALVLIEEFSEKTPAGQLIRCIHYDINKVKEKRFPTRKELDRVSHDNPVWINSIEYHMSAVNSLALHLVNLPYYIDGISRDERNLPKGLLTGKASAFFRNKVFDQISDRKRSLGVNKAIENAIKKGVTTIHAMEGGFSFHDKDAQFIIDNLERFPIDIKLFYQSYDLEKVTHNNLPRVGGDIFVDGSFGAETAALTEQYNNSKGKGNLYFKDDELDYFVKQAVNNNLQISLHTIGDAAIKQAIRSFKKYFITDEIKHLRHRLEHFELSDDQDIRDAKDLNLIISVQPVFEYLWGYKDGMYERKLGDRYLKTNPFKKYLDQGLILIGGSDSDVTGMDPILGIHSAVNHPKPEFSIPIYEAIKMFTKNIAYSTFEEDIKGTIEREKFADLVVLNRDPYVVNNESIKDIEVDLTIKEGKILFSRM